MRRAPWLCVLLSGCTTSNLYGLDSQPNLADRISLQGDLCTDDPAAVNFPVKVLVVMDGTADMVMGDPKANRAAMLQTLLDRYSGPNYSFGFVQYAGQARDLTSGFARDSTALQPAVDAIGIGTQEAQRNYLDALRAAETAVQDDILSSTPGTRSRTRYVVLWTAAGPPVPALPIAWCTGNNLDPKSPACAPAFTAEFCRGVMPAPADCEQVLYQAKAAELRAYALDHGAEDLVFDTFALTSDARASALLTQMAFASQGSYSQQRPDALNLLRTDIAAASSVLLERSFVVYSPNTLIEGGRPAPDSDGDGLSDAEEARLGTDPRRADTDGDHVGDGIEVRLAAPGLMFDPLVPHVPGSCATIDPPDRDSDSDGLLDCEEAVLRTDPSLVDTDRDGLPDQLEWNRGSDPLADDLLVDSDHDGIPNGQEVSEGLSAIKGQAASELEYGYRYRLTPQTTSTQLEPLPHDPLPGVLAVRGDGSTPTVAAIRYAAQPRATLWFASDVHLGDYGDPVDVSAGGDFQLKSAPPDPKNPGVGSRMLTVSVTAAALPGPAPAGMRPMGCPKDGSPCDALAQVLIRPTVRSCFHFDVRNIPLASTLDLPGGRPGAGWSQLLVYLGQLPMAAPRGYLVFDLATVPVRFLPPDKKTPARPFVLLDQFSFLLLEGTP